MTPLSRKFNNYRDMFINDGEIPVFGMRILQYFDENGDLAFKVKQTGDLHATQIIGLLQQILFELNLRASALGKKND